MKCPISQCNCLKSWSVNSFLFVCWIFSLCKFSFAINFSSNSLQAYPHKYPYDWRTKKPTIFRATEQWFASVGTFRADALEAIDKVIVHIVKWWNVPVAVSLFFLSPFLSISLLFSLSLTLLLSLPASFSVSLYLSLSLFLLVSFSLSLSFFLSHSLSLFLSYSLSLPLSLSPSISPSLFLSLSLYLSLSHSLAVLCRLLGYQLLGETESQPWLRAEVIGVSHGKNSYKNSNKNS